MRKRILRIAMAVLMLAVMVPSALAATYEEINQDGRLLPSVTFL